MKRHEGKTSGALVVNLFGGPGTGKTTMAARIFSELKQRGIEAACPEEHAKLLIWSGRPWLLDHQVILMGKIYETLLNLRDKAQVIIVDGPMLLCSVYAGDREKPAFHQLVTDLHKQTDRVNLSVQRERNRPYDPSNRRETEGAALKIDGMIHDALLNIGETPDVVTLNDDVGKLSENIISCLK